MLTTGTPRPGGKPFIRPKEDEMICHRHTIAAFSLVELLVVLAIVALLTGIAVPTMGRMGVWSTNDVDHSARTIFGLMRSARMYAVANRVDTAVIYNIVDAPTGEPVINGFGVARQLRQRELQDLPGYDDSLPGGGALNRTQYVMVSSPEAKMQILPETTSIELAVDSALWIDEYGFTPLHVWQQESGAYSELIPGGTFYGHVFAPAGHVRIGDTGKMRVTLRVREMPGTEEADETLRMVDIELVVSTARSSLRDVGGAS